MSAANAVSAVERVIRKLMEPITPYQATVTAVSSGLVTIQKLGDTTASTRTCKRLAGFDLAVNDQVMCLDLLGTPTVIGKVQSAAPSAFSLAGGFVNDITYVQNRHGTSDTANTTSTSAWSVAIETDSTLPAGTWRCLPMFDVRVQHSAGGNADIRIVVNGSASLTLTEAFPNTVPGASAHHSTVITGVVSDGSTAIVATGEFRSNAAGTTTPTGPRLVLIWQRTA